MWQVNLTHKTDTQCLLASYAWLVKQSLTGVEISGTSATLGTSGHTMTCVLVGSDSLFLQYRWKIGGNTQQDFSSDNQLIIPTVGVSDARSDYSCDVRNVGDTYTGNASLQVTSE